MKEINDELYTKLKHLGIINDANNNVRNYNVGNSDYSKQLWEHMCIHKHTCVCMYICVCVCREALEILLDKILTSISYSHYTEFLVCRHI